MHSTKEEEEEDAAFEIVSNNHKEQVTLSLNLSFNRIDQFLSFLR